jgi:hypothetical protein
MQDTKNSDIESLLLAPPEYAIRIESRANKSKNKFLRGPIDWFWLTAAARLPGSALHIAVAIHFLNGFEQTGTVKLKPSVWRQLGLKRHTVYRAVDELEAAGLISAERKKGCSPMITLCQPTRG